MEFRTDFVFSMSSGDNKRNPIHIDFENKYTIHANEMDTYATINFEWFPREQKEETRNARISTLTFKFKAPSILLNHYISTAAADDDATATKNL